MDALQTAAGTYCDKLATTFFSSFALRAYQQLAVPFRLPILDLGCGDGRFGAMLLRFVDAPVGAVGVDINDQDIARARIDPATGAHYDEFVTADARDLPFDDDSVATIFANGVLCSLRGDLTSALRQIHRVLKPGGNVLASMCTDRFGERYWIRQTLETLGLPYAAARYTAAMDQRVEHYLQLSADEWAGAFVRANLQVHTILGFFPPQLVTTWSAFACTPLRINGLVKYLPVASAKRLAQRTHQRLCVRRFTDTPVHGDPQQSAYILIHAGKSANAAA